MKTAGKCSFNRFFGISSQGSGDRDKKYVLCLLYSVFYLLFSGLYGCASGQHIQMRELSYEKLSASYNQAKLKTSSSLDVLRIIREAESDLRPLLKEMPVLVQNEIALASAGQSKNGYKTWMTLVAFDESANGGMARRKYFYLVDEKAWVKPFSLRHFQAVPKAGLIFDSQMVLLSELLDEPYVTEDARQIAILKQIAEHLHKDVTELGKDNQQLAVSGMLMDQVFKSLLHEFEKSPSLAKNLSDKAGIQLNHLNFGKGRIRITAEGNVVTIKCRLGIFTQLFDESD